MDAFGDAGIGGADVAFNVMTGWINKNETDELAIFIADIRRPGLVSKIGQFTQWHLRAGGRGHKHALELVQVIAKIARITDADGIAFTTFHGGGNGVAANGCFNGVIDIANGQAMARGGLAIDGEIEEITAGRPFCKNAARVRQIGQRLFNLHADVLNRAQVGPEDFDAELRTKPGREHFGSRLDGHPEDVGHAGRF